MVSSAAPAKPEEMVPAAAAAAGTVGPGPGDAGAAAGYGHRRKRRLCTRNTDILAAQLYQRNAAAAKTLAAGWATGTAAAIPSADAVAPPARKKRRKEYLSPSCRELVSSQAEGKEEGPGAARAFPDRTVAAAAVGSTRSKVVGLAAVSRQKKNKQKRRKSKAWACMLSSDEGISADQVLLMGHSLGCRYSCTAEAGCGSTSSTTSSSSSSSSSSVEGSDMGFGRGMMPRGCCSRQCLLQHLNACKRKKQRLEGYRCSKCMHALSVLKRGEREYLARERM